MDQLSSFLENAPQEEELKAADPHKDNWTEQEISLIAHEGLELMAQKCADPVVHKAALLFICNNMVQWHTKVAQNTLSNGDTDCGTAWMRDAGKWQAIMDIATSIALGPNDSWLDQE